MHVYSLLFMLSVVVTINLGYIYLQYMYIFDSFLMHTQFEKKLIDNPKIPLKNTKAPIERPTMLEKISCHFWPFWQKMRQNKFYQAMNEK